MKSIEYIFAHGSGNRFVLIDATNEAPKGAEQAEYVRGLCRRFESDGLLFVERTSEGEYAMNMYNTDGTQAEMGGNGMRIVARYVDEIYTQSESFTLYSSGRAYPIRRATPTVVEGVAIPNYGVQIEVHTSSDEFSLSREGGFVDSSIEELHPDLSFTYLNLGNPHVVALVDDIDLELLSELGERVKSLPHIFTKGVNVSLMQSLSPSEIFVATYERGVGLTPSCGTAMTASSTAATLMGLTKWSEPITVRNRGGFVECCCTAGEPLRTELIGNATYMERGVIETIEDEQRAWSILTNK